MMKRCIAVILALVLLCLMTLPATADEQTINLVPLSNQELISVLKNSGFDGWAFYQPSARETTANTSSGQYLDPQNTYPVIAIRDGNTSLIVLKKANMQWMVSVTNSRALTRKGFVLSGFSMDENHSGIDNIQYVYFDFEDQAGDSLALSLQLSDIYPSYFSHMRYHGLGFGFNYDRGITLQTDYPFLCRYSYEINPKQANVFNVDGFSFNECPVTVQELFVPATISPKNEVANLFLFPDDAKEPIIQLARNEKIHVASQQPGSDWALVCYSNNLLFIHATDISLDHQD